MDINYQEIIRRIEEAKLNDSKVLDLSYLELENFPKEIYQLPNLTELDLSYNKLSSLPETIGENLNNLTQLDLENNKLTSIPDAIGKLIHLTKLYADNNLLITIPDTIEKLTNLTELYLGSNKLTLIPEPIGKLTNLKKLILHDNRLLSIFPESLGNLTNLNMLFFGRTFLKSLPVSIGKLTNLKHLELTNNKLSSLPETIGELTKLQHLELTNNQLSSLPETIGKLYNLKHLELTNNKLSSLPETIGELSNLKHLELTNNQLSSLPETIGELYNLKHLELTNNLLLSLPKTIGKLYNLKHFELDNNRLSSLPKTIVELTNLKHLKLTNNQFMVDFEIYGLELSEQIHEILTSQNIQETQALEPIHEAKVIFIGESNYGKTHLIEFLKEGSINRTITTTHGVERSQITIPYPEKDIQLNIWELGGQEFMRSTHQFFFSERTLYVLVTLARRERNELNHWLKLVNQLGNKAPVLVVINKIDLDPHDLDRKSLERDYPNIIGFVRTCIIGEKAKDTLDLLKRRITEIVSNKDIMPSVFEQRPSTWFTVKEELEKLEAEGKDFISYAEYEQLDFIQKLSEDERKSNLRLLNTIGTVVSFVDDPLLIETNVINPQWIMDGVYAIINDPKVKDDDKGKLHIKDLERILPKDKFPTERHAYLLELMEKFNLCYPAKDERDVYFIPDLFDDIEPDATWNEDDVSIHFRYNYDDFSPDAFMTRFIVEMHQDIQNDQRWRSGVYISNGACQAKIYQAYRKNFIHIEITGNVAEGRSYLYTIRESFRKLHQTFSEMQITEEVYYKDNWLEYLELIELEVRNESKYHTKLKERLPITDILNGYTSVAERKGNLKVIKIFLASSYELKVEREQFEIFINRENKWLIEQGVFLKLEILEDFIDAMSQTRLQNEYNYVVQQSDIFVSLFFTKVGKYTLEEFGIAFGQFKATGKPLVYTYFKQAEINTGDITHEIKSLLDFKGLLRNLGHFESDFKNIDDLKFQFKKQLEKILPRIQ